tara:strand:- start:310276 stop:311325 length:1050 start_codon:yes stop_codon:yes gene_type:complete
MSKTTEFASRVLHWFDQHGRKDLPWQREIDAYRVWVSEIMLQQTQVKTVIPYFERFMQAFPTVQALAGAPEDQVLHLWTGLGYYARARNLHRSAKIVASDFNGVFPDSVDGLCELPGIGRSTAGAIVSIAGKRRAVILDGNVKRVLARHQAIAGWPGKTAIHKRLWEVADELTPTQRCADYTQAMMDLGATVCTRSKPACSDCPVSADCIALAQGTQTQYPGKKPRKVLPIKSTTMMMVTAASGDVWLERRPNSGIWGGLWCFPEAEHDIDIDAWCIDRWQIHPAATAQWASFRHTFSHYHLDITPLHITLGNTPQAVMEGSGQLWYNIRKAPEIGLAAPVASLLARLR